ncbi:CBU_0592 family membrane protein [Ochrovirga pacifica]|uniref:CBU_0592 family membrane protein n=1 Tax=Ochrovirga pacifica TaxID=1042376 RepID=UPI0008FBC5F5|nr:hypothetical protein [Ochrovirga pacifica]
MWFTIVGWIGVFVFIIAYLLLSLNVLSAQKTTYHWLNVLGAACLVFNSTVTKDVPSVAVNTLWGIIALCTCLNLRIKFKKVQKTQAGSKRDQ